MEFIRARGRGVSRRTGAVASLVMGSRSLEFAKEQAAVVRYTVDRTFIYRRLRRELDAIEKS